MIEGPRELLSGWGRAAPSLATVVRPAVRADLERVVSEAAGSPSKRCVARGLGRAYGDAAQCAGGVVLDCRRLDAVLELDEEQALLRAEGGLSLDALLRLIVPMGYFVPVTPGTRHVTLGGAVASDIHGKNHHVDGSIGAHIEQLSLVTAVGPRRCGPVERPDEFAATCGGMGLTGVVAEATIRLLPIETSLMRVDTERARDLDACLSMLAGERGRYRYSVAWVDALASGGRLGRSLLTRGDHALVHDLPATARRRPLDYSARQLARVPVRPPCSLLTAASIAAFNELWYHKAPRRRLGELQTIPTFFHPLDAVGGWNVLYGPRGFTQYQFAVPFGAEHVVRSALERLRAARVASSLAVLKCFGPEGAGHLSFPMEGWTLALDLPLGSEKLPAILDGLDELVAEAGGRIYLSKDGRLRPELVRAMYPRLAEWETIRHRLDPDGIFSSDLARRLGLGGVRRHVAEGAA